MLGKTEKVVETFTRMRLLKKYCCVVLPSTEDTFGMLRNIKDFVAYGTITEETLAKLIKERGRVIENSKGRVSESDAKKFAKEVLAGKKLQDLKVKPFFRLHSPRGGIDSKLHFGKRKGVLGNHKDKINELIERML